MIETRDGFVKATGDENEILADIGAVLDAIAEHWEVSVGELLWAISAMMYCCQEEDEEEGEDEEDGERGVSKERDREEMESAMQRRIRTRGNRYRRG